MKPSHDLSGLMKFATRPEWAEHLRDALDDHLGPAMNEFEFEADELPDLVGEHWASILWGCVVEDLATRTLEPDGRNLVDDYLKRRGWNEAGPNKLYMRALRSSVMSLYEVSDIEPGTGLLARDLIRGGEPVRVSERSASRTLKQWDKIGARIVAIGGKHLLSGGVLSFTMEAADALMAGLRRAEGKRSPRAKLTLDDDALQRLASLISTAWLFDVVPRAIGMAAPPTLHNADGDEVVFHRVRFPFAHGITQAAVAERLDRDPLQPIDLGRVRDEQQRANAGRRQCFERQLIRRRHWLQVEELGKLGGFFLRRHLRDQRIGAGLERRFVWSKVSVGVVHLPGRGP